MERSQLQELIQADLDGELSVAERAGLARVLMQDPGARRLHSEFRRTDRLLREIAQAEPPPGLRAAILAGSAQPVHAGDRGRRQYGRPLYRVAAAVLGGLLLVGVSYLLLDGNARQADLQGSLGAARGPDSAVQAGTQDQLSMRSGSVEVSATLRRNGQRLRLEISSSATIPCEVVARIDPAMTTFVGNPDEVQLTAASGQVTIPLAAGSRTFVLDFSGAALIQLQLRSGGRLLQEGRLSVSDP